VGLEVQFFLEDLTGEISESQITLNQPKPSDIDLVMDGIGLGVIVMKSKRVIDHLNGSKREGLSSGSL
jgi:hypothetical protein